MAIILKGSPSESINTSHKLQPKQPGVELLDNGYSRLKIGSTTNLTNLNDETSWIPWSDLPYATPNPQIYQDSIIDLGDMRSIDWSSNDIKINTSDYNLVIHSLSENSDIVVTGSGIYCNPMNTSYLGTESSPWDNAYIKKICTNSTDGLGIAFTNISSSPIYKFTTNGFEPGGAYNLGSSSAAWQSVYSNKYLSGSNMALTFGFANGSTAFSAGYSPEALVPGVIKNLGTYDNAWYGIYATTLNVQQLKGMGTNPVILTTTLLQPAFFGGSNLGDITHAFENGFFQNVNLVNNNFEGMSITYNSSEECLEFLVS